MLLETEKLQDENDCVFVNLFKNFRILKLKQIINKRDQLKKSLPDEILLDPQGNAKHNDYIAQWQEQSWIYEGITNTLTDIILLFILIQEYAPTMNKVLIIMHNELL